jgi:hypothetical protein
MEEKKRENIRKVETGKEIIKGGKEDRKYTARFLMESENKRRQEVKQTQSKEKQEGRKRDKKI